MTKLFSLCNNYWSVMNTDPIWYTYSLDFSSSQLTPFLLFSPQKFIKRLVVICHCYDLLFFSRQPFIKNASLLNTQFCFICFLFVDKSINCLMTNLPRWITRMIFFSESSRYLLRAPTSTKMLEN